MKTLLSIVITIAIAAFSVNAYAQLGVAQPQATQYVIHKNVCIVSPMAFLTPSGDITSGLSDIIDMLVPITPLTNEIAALKNEAIVGKCL